MRRKATVERILPDGTAELAVRRESVCSGDCHQCSGCGAVEQVLRLTAENPIRAQRGDIVWIEAETAVVLWAAVLVYLLPLVLFLAGYLAALPLGGRAAAVGGGGFVLGLLPAFAYNRKLKQQPTRYTVVGFVR